MRTTEPSEAALSALLSDDLEERIAETLEGTAEFLAERLREGLRADPAPGDLRSVREALDGLAPLLRSLGSRYLAADQQADPWRAAQRLRDADSRQEFSADHWVE